MSTDSPPADTAADGRMSEILDAVRDVFAAKGFDRASMQDLARAAGMSAGNFYRYFPSKDAIIEALVGRNMRMVEENFARIMQAEDPVAALRAVLHRQLDMTDCADSALMAETIAAARRSAGIGRLYEGLERTITAHLVAVFGHVAGIGRDEARLRFDSHARMVFLIIQGIRLRRRPGDEGEHTVLRGLAQRLIDVILAEIVDAIPAAQRPAERGACHA